MGTLMTAAIVAYAIGVLFGIGVVLLCAKGLSTLRAEAHQIDPVLRDSDEEHPRRHLRSVK